jgi:GT2 family glycosyltransferase
MDAASAPDVTIAVVPRERFSKSAAALENLLARTPPPFELIYVDGGSPPKVAEFLRRKAAERGFRLIRTERYLTPNEARNLALPHVKTRYVVFMDNDVFVEDGWLAPLVECAEETGAWVVGPLSFEGEPEEQRIHLVGGRMAVVEQNGKRRIETEHFLSHRRLADVSEPLVRKPCDFAEFHLCLVRRAAFDATGPLDERLMSSREHLDFCLLVKRAGGTVWVEPRSRNTYMTPPPLDWTDLPFFLRRWSEARNEISFRHFCEKWDLDIAHLAERKRKANLRRLAVLRPVRRRVERALGKRGAGLFDRALAAVEPSLNRALFRE